MFYLYILFLVVNTILFAKSNVYTNDDYNIKMNLSLQTYNANSYESDKTFVVLRNRAFHIELVNYTANEVSCQIFGDTYNFKTKLTHADKAGLCNSNVTVAPATENMTGKWKCIIKRDKPAIDLAITFKVRVKGGANKHVKMEIGGRTLSTTLSSSSEKEYDEVGEYIYRHGDTVDLACSNVWYQDTGMIYLRYYNSKGRTLIRTGELKSYLLKNGTIIFQKKMYAANNNDMIDCTYVTAKDQIEFSHRVIFKHDTAPSNSAFNITINGLELTSNRNTVTETSDRNYISWYHFIFLPNQMLTVTCQLYNDHNHHLQFVDKNDRQLNALLRPDYQVIEYNTSMGTLLLPTVNFVSGDHIICSASDPLQSKLQAHILLTKREQPILQISGLVAKNVLSQYTNTSKDWVIDYMYSAGEVLNITCVSRDTRPLWLFESSKIQNASSETQKINHIFTLRGTHRINSIICQDGINEEEYMLKVIIKLHRKSSPPSGPSNAPADSSVTISADTPDDAPGDDSNNTSDYFDVPVTNPPNYDAVEVPDEWRNQKLLIGGAVALCFITITTLSVVFFYRRHKRARIQQSHEHLLHESNAPIPAHPKQWDSRPEYNGSPQECMVRNSLYNSSGQKVCVPDNGAENLYVEVDYLQKGNLNNARSEYKNIQAVQNEDRYVSSGNYSNLNTIGGCSGLSQNDQIPDCVYAEPYAHKFMMYR